MIRQGVRSLSSLWSGRLSMLTPCSTCFFRREFAVSSNQFQQLPGIITRSFASHQGVKEGLTRNVREFAPFLNEFIAKFPMTSNKSEIIKNLEKKCQTCGFTSLGKTANEYQKEATQERAVNLYSMLVIATIQVKDSTLLHYVLEDADRYIDLSSSSVYEVLRRVCHFRQYSEFLAFLDRFLLVFDLIFYYDLFSHTLNRNYLPISIKWACICVPKAILRI